MDQLTLDYIRKLAKTDKKSLVAKALKTTEEVGELAKVVLPFDGAPSTQHRFIDKVRILEEVADGMLCLLSIAYDLGYSDSEIEQMMLHKAKYWGELQAREKKASFPVPFEMHVTVKTNEIEQFKLICGVIGVKPIVLDLQDQAGEHVMHDVMTSSAHIGDNQSVYKELNRIANGLRAGGFDVIREKIETVPWHPAAPSIEHSNPSMPKDCYFESHLAVLCSDSTKAMLSEICKAEGCHLSRNAFKKITGDQYIIMTTYRVYDGTAETFREDVQRIRTRIEEAGFEVEKEIVEFSLFDTKVHHDKEWLLGVTPCTAP